MAIVETLQRIEPTRLEEPSEAISDVVAEAVVAKQLRKRDGRTE